MIDECLTIVNRLIGRCRNSHTRVQLKQTIIITGDGDNAVNQNGTINFINLDVLPELYALQHQLREIKQDVSLLPGKNLNLDHIRRLAVTKAIEVAHGNKSQAAKMLGIKRGSLYYYADRDKKYLPVVL